MQIPASTKSSLEQKLSHRQRDRRPPLTEIKVRYRGNLAYIDGVEADGEVLPLGRLRYGGYANPFGLAVYLASKDGSEDSDLPTGAFEGSPEEALDCACGLYLGDPTAWVTT